MFCRTFIITIMAVLLCAGAGCSPNQAVKDTWKGTKDLYRSYLNVPASVDLEERSELEDVDSQLAVVAEKIDLELRELERWMENAPLEFDVAWSRKIMQRFPWLSGVAWTNAEGEVLSKQAQGFLKEFNVAPLLEVDPKQKLSALRAYVQSSPLGYEVYVGNPVYNGEEFRGLIVGFFDPRTIIGFSPEPELLVMADAQQVFWPGIYETSSLPFNTPEWAQLLHSSPSGVVKNASGKLKWTSRFLANHEFAYAVVQEGAFAENKAQLDGIDRRAGRHYGVGDKPLPSLQEPMRNINSQDGDVGNVGRPNVSPEAPATHNPKAETVKTETIKE